MAPFFERFWAKVEKTDGCWLWTAQLDRGGYGRVRVDDRQRCALAHKAIYEACVGPVPEGFELHHECENPRCVRIDHFVLVTKADHGRLSMAHKTVRDSCPHGHPFDAENTYIPPGRRDRQCRACRRVARRKAEARV